MVDGVLVATELFGVSKMLEAADIRADDELVVSVREVLPFCKIFDKVPFDVPIVGLLCIAIKQKKKCILYKICENKKKQKVIFHVKCTCCS